MAVESSRSKRKEVDVGELLKRLRLNGAEHAGIFFAEVEGKALQVLKRMTTVDGC
jgi:hypothetical protein